MRYECLSALLRTSPAPQALQLLLGRQRSYLSGPPPDGGVRRSCVLRERRSRLLERTPAQSSAPATLVVGFFRNIVHGAALFYFILLFSSGGVRTGRYRQIVHAPLRRCERDCPPSSSTNNSSVSARATPFGIGKIVVESIVAAVNSAPSFASPGRGHQATRSATRRQSAAATMAAAAKAAAAAGEAHGVDWRTARPAP